MTDLWITPSAIPWIRHCRISQLCVQQAPPFWICHCRINQFCVQEDDVTDFQYPTNRKYDFSCSCFRKESEQNNSEFILEAIHVFSIYIVRKVHVPVPTLTLICTPMEN